MWNFNSIDFNPVGNTNELTHLINPHDKYSPTKSDINFGFGLRKYKSLSGFQLDKPWRNPKFKGIKEFDPLPENFLKVKTLHSNRESVEEDNTEERKIVKKLKVVNKYNDQFPQRNASGIRHLFEKSGQVGSIKWQSGLRFTSDKEHYLITKK